MIEDTMKAYTYTITHISTGNIYYGVRKSSIEDIGVDYFSSSKLINRLIQEDGIENFSFKVRRKFDTYEDARKHETKFLQRVKAVSNPRFYNQAISSPRVCKKDSHSEEKRKQSISETMKLLWQSEDYRNRQKFNKLSKEERSKRGRKGGLATAKTRTKKPKNKPTYSEILIVKDGKTKTVKRNQVPAYRKYGWERANGDPYGDRTRYLWRDRPAS